MSLRLVFLALFAALTTCLASGVAFAQVTAPSIYTRDIVVQGEAEGTEFDDWASSGIPIATSDPADNPGSIDIADVQIANDSDYIYIHATFHTDTTLDLSQVFLGFDTDQDLLTGFDVFSVGLVGSDFAYQTDYPFHQVAGIYNTNLSIQGGPIGNGGALIFPYWQGVESPPAGTQFEWAIPLDAYIVDPIASLAFTSPSFTFVVFVDDQILGDVTDAISYTLAEPPPGEPGDFDADGDVDGDDFLLWQRDGGVGSLADWAANFGAATAATMSVPEPTACWLLTFAACSFASRRRRGN
ncbi:MAG: hypothetical protein KDA61_06160 [Planctomycetales bacterium]|nr:hypothetical protein [Planctomycetales bacterium]